MDDDDPLFEGEIPRPCFRYRQEQDEYVCTNPRCRLRWDVQEEQPPCPLST